MILAVLVFTSFLRYSRMNLKDKVANIFSTFSELQKVCACNASKQKMRYKSTEVSTPTNGNVFKTRAIGSLENSCILAHASEESSCTWRSKSSASFEFLWILALFKLRSWLLSRQSWHGNDVWVARLTKSIFSQPEVSRTYDDRSMWNKITVLSALLQGRTQTVALAKLCTATLILSCKASKKFVLGFSVIVSFATVVQILFKMSSVCKNSTRR